ncbi:MAG: hypothetical protein WAP52_04075 [Candidatus Sungiibacteriota bacterium]
MVNTTISGESIAQQTFVRFGAWSGIVGAVIFMIANIIHPRSPNIESTAAQIQTVAQSNIWLTDHLLLLMGGFMLLGGLLAIQRLMADGSGSAWAKIGSVSAMVSTSVWVVLMALDGIASKVVHNSWAMASGQEQAVALRVAEMMEEIDIALFSVYIILFFGITLFLYGLAVTKSAVFPRWLGGTAMALAVASFVVGVVQAYTGLSVLITNTLFASFSSFLTLWILIMGVLILRKARVMPSGVIAQ